MQERGVWHFVTVDDELGSRVGAGLGISVDDVRHLEPLQSQTPGEDELARLANLARTAPVDVEGLVVTHCVPTARVQLA